MSERRRSDKSGGKPGVELRADAASRQGVRARTAVPTAPSVLVLSAALALIALALFFWMYRLQTQQAELHSLVQGRLTEVLERMELSGVDGQASFEEIGLSLKALDDRLKELWKLVGERQQTQLETQDRALEEQQAAQQELARRIDEQAAELELLGGLLEDQKDQIGGTLAERIREAGRSAASLDERQRLAGERLDQLAKRLEHLETMAASVEAYRRTTNQVVLRLEARMTLLENRLADTAGSAAERDFPGIASPLSE